MKVLLAGDSHGRISTIKEYLEVADERECDIIFVLGDFGYWEHELEGIEYLNLVDYYADQFAMPVYFLDGNHDKTSLLLEKYHERDNEGFIKVRPWVRYSPRGHRWTWDHVRFMSLGGAYSVDKAWRLEEERKASLNIAKKNAYRPVNNQRNEDTSGTLWFPEEEITDADLEMFLTDTSPVDILLTHDKPRATTPECIRKDLPECWPNQDRIQRAVTTLQPEMLFHGHLHDRYEQEIRCGDGDKYTKVIGLSADAEAGSAYVLNVVSFYNDEPHHF